MFERVRSRPIESTHVLECRHAGRKDAQVWNVARNFFVWFCYYYIFSLHILFSFLDAPEKIMFFRQSNINSELITRDFTFLFVCVFSLAMEQMLTSMCSQARLARWVWMWRFLYFFYSFLIVFVLTLKHHNSQQFCMGDQFTCAVQSNNTASLIFTI